MANYIVGLTGGIGSGKTTISRFFEQLGVTVVDADIIAREVVAKGKPALEKIAQHFGKEILLENGELNRALLREKIFHDAQEKAWLNQLMHPIIRQDILAALTQCSGDYCILSAPLLFENKLNEITNRNLVIDVSPASQIARTTKRDSVNQQQVEAIIASQISREQRLSLADDIIENESADLSQAKQQVVQLNAKYQNLAAK
ncbi:dephospho-CoA kinase [Thalassotalea sp. G2M2-11]|uniref:dephospho-CoA kinase n=1 Tax=Thalassotalea sp. G2M2-11 TaxID=2787627 RepID=UPI0019D1E723|nr:dephospho-CoA kinase [Thalassotalea sp. G2M2-11]